MNFFDRIPLEMRSYQQWLVWVYEETINGKPTKVPHDAKTGFLASVDNPATWASYDHCVQVAMRTPAYAGIGFVLTKNDPYCISDLDGTTDPGIIARQIKIFETFDTYTERSPSRTGIHMIMKAEIPSGRKRGAVELYSSGRFMTMTGDVFHDKPIAFRQDLANVLWGELGKTDKGEILVTNEPQKEDDDAVLMKCGNSVSFGFKFRDLFEGRWQQYYTSQSEADMAFYDMVQLYTRNCDQIERLFLRSSLGQRDKAKRRDYREMMLLKSFDRMAPPADFERMQANLAAFRPQNANAPLPGLASNGASLPGQEPREVSPQAGALGSADGNKSQQRPAVNPYTQPPGLMGKIAKYLHDSAPRKVPEIALIGAIGFMAGMCGRAYNTPTNAGLNLYTLLVAKSGRGKEAIQTGISRIVNTVSRLTPNNPSAKVAPSIVEFVGPSDIRSDMGLLRELERKPCMFAMMGEFGLKLQAMTAIHANSNLVALRAALLDIYGKSGKDSTLGGSAYSDRAKNTAPIASPALSLICESTPSTFYEALTPALIAQGLLPRFLCIEYHGERPAMNYTPPDPDPALCGELVDLVSQCHMLMNSGQIIKAQFDNEAWGLQHAYDERCTHLINTSESDAIGEIWNRAHLKALKLSSLVAVGVNSKFPTVTREIWEWAEAIVTYDVENIVHHFEAGLIGRVSDDSEQDKDFIDIVVDYLSKDFEHVRPYCPLKEAVTYHHDKIIPATYFTMRLQSRASFKNAKQGYKHALFNTLRSFIDRGIIVEDTANKIRDKQTGQAGRYSGHGKVYWVADETQFLARYQARQHRR